MFRGSIKLMALAGAFSLWAGTAGAVDLYLKAQEFDLTLPDSTVIKMWGYVETDLNGDPLTGAVPSSPGPELVVPEGETLRIHLFNALPAGVDPPPAGTSFGVPDATSLVIPGQSAIVTPTFFTDTEGRNRVRSFTHETPIGGAAVVYEWAAAKAGTYIYHSGTHPQVQVQMGLYGPLTVNAVTPGQAYDNPESTFDREERLFYSEVDPALHAAVAGGTYGTGATTSTMTSTLGYAPTILLVNGQPFDGDPFAVTGTTPGQLVLLRLRNMGLTTRAPVRLDSSQMTVIAEDGNPYPYPKAQHSMLLAAGQTKDAILTADGDIAVFDRSFRFSPVDSIVPLLVAEVSPSPGATAPTVEEAPASDTLICKRAVYRTDRDALNVMVKSDDLSGQLRVVAFADFGSGDERLGRLRFKRIRNGQSIYKRRFRNIASAPDTIRARSSAGGSCTRSVNVKRPSSVQLQSPFVSNSWAANIDR